MPENGGQSPAVLLDAGGAATSGSGAGFESSFGAGSSSPVSELRAATPEKAAFFLDAALANRTSQRQSHLKGESGTDAMGILLSISDSGRFVDCRDERPPKRLYKSD